MRVLIMLYIAVTNLDKGGLRKEGNVQDKHTISHGGEAIRAGTCGTYEPYMPVTWQPYQKEE